MLHLLALSAQLSLGAALVGASTTPAPNTPRTSERACVVAAPDEQFRVDFRDIKLRDFTRLVACAAAMNVVFNPTKLDTRSVTVIAPRPVSLDGLQKLYRLTLARQGLSLERRGSYHIVRDTRR